MPSNKWMIYGATGYTGQLIAAEAVKRGHRPLLAGRSAAKLKPLADRLGLDYVAVGLDDSAALTEAVKRVSAVLHAAGPYVHTARPMLDACLRGVTNYLDITGEIAVFEQVFNDDQRFYDRMIAAVPGVGFDVVPTDCLANTVAAQVPAATTLEIAIVSLGVISQGTAKTLLEIVGGGGGTGQLRRDGKLVPYGMGRGARTFRFPHGERLTMPIPWGDLATAYRSTGIPNITTYMAQPPERVRALRWAAPLLRLLRIGAVRRLAGRAIDQMETGPSDAVRASDQSYVYARAADADGQAAEAWLTLGEGYDFTAKAAVNAVERLLDERPRGVLTPAQAFGADFVLGVAGVSRQDAL
jgi:short subunit dehydrogenase-like uncharacterized protein